MRIFLGAFILLFCSIHFSFFYGWGSCTKYRGCARSHAFFWCFGNAQNHTNTSVFAHELQNTLQIPRFSTKGAQMWAQWLAFIAPFLRCMFTWYPILPFRRHTSADPRKAACTCDGLLELLVEQNCLRSNFLLCSWNLRTFNVQLTSTFLQKRPTFCSIGVSGKWWATFCGVFDSTAEAISTRRSLSCCSEEFCRKNRQHL